MIDRYIDRCIDRCMSNHQWYLNEYDTDVYHLIYITKVDEWSFRYMQFVCTEIKYTDSNRQTYCYIHILIPTDIYWLQQTDILLHTYIAYHSIDSYCSSPSTYPYHHHHDSHLVREHYAYLSSSLLLMLLLLQEDGEGRHHPHHLFHSSQWVLKHLPS